MLSIVFSLVILAAAIGLFLLSETQHQIRLLGFVTSTQPTI